MKISKMKTKQIKKELDSLYEMTRDNNSKTFKKIVRLKKLEYEYNARVINNLNVDRKMKVFLYNAIYDPEYAVDPQGLLVYYKKDNSNFGFIS